MLRKYLLFCKLILLVFLLCNFKNSQIHTTIYGEQKRGKNKNAELKCTPVILTQTSQIIKIEGLNNGFWIAGEKGIVKNFFPDSVNTKIYPGAVGFVLNPGKYWVYPNLLENEELASVKIILISTNKND